MRAKRVVSGFRMEGDPVIEMVFGDITRLRHHVDAFYMLHRDMRTVRTDFQRYIRAAQTTLETRKRGCPNVAVAPLYARSYERGQRYRELGAQFEAHYGVIHTLDELGETAGLTPDYRWRVHRSRRLYRAALTDYREIRTLFDTQLAAELRFRRCDAQMLLTQGARALATAITTTPHKETKPASPAGLRSAPASATFFVNNKSCANRVAVYVDGIWLGDAASHAKAVFQTPPGRHDMCFIPASSSARCGSAGTVRSMHIHDGWSITMRCE